MKIKKIEICGFKSFVDRSVIHFDHDVTGIVGPNGCGKSNIVDAIRWCMGEQSAKHLRGKSMDDVIFNGSEARGPHSFAEVTITFDNTAGVGAPEYRDYAEIAVTRRLDRAGNSDYAINKTPVRLMDITELFLGTGVGTKAYSIIEQGRIGFIVSSKPEDRRHLIEEAAGITKFKHKKKAAERKMEQTRANLLRVGDLVSEIERSIASLKRQAQKAARYKEYRSEIRELELLAASHKYMELVAVTKYVVGELEEATAIAEGSRLALRVREAEFESERLAVSEVERTVETAQTRAFMVDNQVKQLEAELARLGDRLEALRTREAQAERELAEVSSQHDALARERAGLAEALISLEEVSAAETAQLAAEQEDLDRRRSAAEEAELSVRRERTRVGEGQTRIARAEAVLAGFARRREEARVRLDKMRAEREELEARVMDVVTEADELRARLTGLRGGKEHSAEQKQQLEAELTQLRADVQESDRNVERLRGELAEKRSRLRSLEELQKRFEGVGAGVRAVMQKFGGAEQAAQAGVLGLVADRLEVPSELTNALAGALGERVQDIVVRDLDAGCEVAAWLLEGKRGRAALVPRAPRRVVRAPANLPSEQGVVGWLAELVRADAEDEGLVRHLLEGVLVVEDLATARRLHALVTGATLVTRAGEVLAADGRLVGGTGEGAAAHMLDVKREVRELHVVVARLDTAMSAAVQHHQQIRGGIAERQAELDVARNAAHDTEIALVKAERDLRRAEDDLERTRRRAETVAQDADELSAAISESSDEETAARDEIRSAQEQKRDGEEALEAMDEVYRDRRAAVEEQARVVTEVRVRAAQARQRAEGDRSTVARLDRSLTELGGRSERLTAEVLGGARQQGEILGTRVGLREALSAGVGEAMKAHDVLTAARTRFDAERVRIGEHEVAMREVRVRIERTEKRATELTIRARELVMEHDHLLAHMSERHRIDLRRVLGDYHDKELDAQSKARVDELLKLVERMGEINLTAIEEYEAQAKRFDYYYGHKKDLEDALDQLDKAIRKMNIESKRLFKETFIEVNARFKRVFPKMFGGGQAELRLTNADDVLESGVEIIAQPLGKRLGSIELMSGGEKALTAVSLIFSIFQYKPSPFCLLDEVDAPLDEANIGRFADAIRMMTDKSQFIVITHSKRTMETADVLYGVTMEQPGISKLVSVELRKSEAKRAPKVQDVAVA